MKSSSSKPLLPLAPSSPAGGDWRRLEEPATQKRQLSQRPLEGRRCQCWSPGASLPYLFSTPEPGVPAAAGEGKPAACSLPLPPPHSSRLLTPLGVMLSHILEADSQFTKHFSVLFSTSVPSRETRKLGAPPHFIGKKT